MGVFRDNNTLELGICFYRPLCFTNYQMTLLITKLVFGSFKIALIYASASTFLGPGSMAMHGTHTKFGAWLDNVSMISYILVLWIYNLKRLTNFSNKIYFQHIQYFCYYACSYWFLDSGLGIGVNLFELSIGLWIIEVMIKFPNMYGRVLSGITVLVIQQYLEVQ